MRRFEGTVRQVGQKRGVSARRARSRCWSATLGCTIAVRHEERPNAGQPRRARSSWRTPSRRRYVDEDAAAYHKYLAPDSDLAKYDDYFSTGAAVYRRYVTRYDPETGTALIVYEYEYGTRTRVAAQWTSDAPYARRLPFREAQYGCTSPAKEAINADLCMTI
ncbi:MAG: hypothetical protein ACLR4Z_16690 [Butyricicoccaceae bacterium]